MVSAARFQQITGPSLQVSPRVGVLECWRGVRYSDVGRAIVGRLADHNDHISLRDGGQGKSKYRYLSEAFLLRGLLEIFFFILEKNG